METERWMPIEGFEDSHAVSNFGNIKTLERKYCVGKNCSGKVHMKEKLMAVFTHHDGYKVVWLRKPGVHRKFFVHTLVAKAFIPNPDCKPIVNHIDCNKGNSRADNLEWMSLSENSCYYHATKKKMAAAEQEF